MEQLEAEGWDVSGDGRERVKSEWKEWRLRFGTDFWSVSPLLLLLLLRFVFSFRDVSTLSSVSTLTPLQESFSLSILFSCVSTGITRTLHTQSWWLREDRENESGKEGREEKKFDGFKWKLLSVLIKLFHVSLSLLFSSSSLLSVVTFIPSLFFFSEVKREHFLFKSRPFIIKSWKRRRGVKK